MRNKVMKLATASLILRELKWSSRIERGDFRVRELGRRKREDTNAANSRMRLTEYVDHLFKAEKGIAFTLDRVNKWSTEIDHGRIVLNAVIVVAKGADNVFEYPRHIPAGLDVGLAQVPRDLAANALGHLVGILFNLFIVNQLLLLCGHLFRPVCLLNPEQIQPDFLYLDIE